jgi:hypothetical protein
MTKSSFLFVKYRYIMDRYILKKPAAPEELNWKEEI